MCQWKLLCIMQHILDAKLMGSFGHSGTLVAPGLSHLRRLARVRDLPFAKACRSLAVQHSPSCCSVPGTKTTEQNRYLGSALHQGVLHQRRRSSPGARWGEPWPHSCSSWWWRWLQRRNAHFRGNLCAQGGVNLSMIYVSYR